MPKFKAGDEVVYTRVHNTTQGHWRDLIGVHLIIDSIFNGKYYFHFKDSSRGSATVRGYVDSIERFEYENELVHDCYWPCYL